MIKNSKRVLFIVGPTAVGKSDVAMLLANELGGEIISCDSMQVYREISIASNKPAANELRKIKHHLIDVISIDEDFDVMHFYGLVCQAIEKIHKRRALPIIVGGSGLYMQILLDGIFKGEGKNEQLRKELKSLAAKQGGEFLHERLKEVDPKSAERIHPHDTRRLIRALEVYETTRQPISSLQPNRSGLAQKYDIRLYGLLENREKLYARINERVDKMFEAGLLSEIEALRSKRLSLTAQHLIGIKEILSHLEGEWDLATAKDKMKQNTRQFAKRQMTWFRKEKRITWIDVENKDIHEVVEEIIKEFKYKI